MLADLILWGGKILVSIPDLLMTFSTNDVLSYIFMWVLMAEEQMILVLIFSEGLSSS